MIAPDPALPLRRTGILLVVLSAFVFSTAGIFTRGVDADGWAVIFWRGLAAAGFTLGWLTATGRLVAEIRAFRGPALLVSLLMAAGTAAFIPAFKLGSVANVALIYAAAPFAAAGLAWIFIRERPAPQVMIASLAALSGVSVIVSGSLGGGSVAGDLLALVMTLMMAASMVVYRARPHTTAALPAAISSLILLPVAAAFGDPLSAPPGDLPALILFGLVFAIASVTLSEGARRLPPAETALLSTLEMPLAPILAWLILAEIPQPASVAGGAIIMAAVIGLPGRAIRILLWPLRRRR